MAAARSHIPRWHLAMRLKRKLRLHQSLPRAATLDGSDRLSAWLARTHRHVTLRCRTICCRPRIRQPLCLRPSFLRRSGASVAVFGKSLCVTSFEFGSLGRATIHGDGALSRRPRMQFGEQARARARGKMVCFRGGIQERPEIATTTVQWSSQFWSLRNAVLNNAFSCCQLALLARELG